MDENIKPLSDIPAINRFLSYCRIRAVPSKTVVIHAGDLPDVLYYIISGSVEVMIEDEEGNEMVLAYLNRGQFFGEMGLFYEQPTRSAWAVSYTHLDVYKRQLRRAVDAGAVVCAGIWACSGQARRCDGRGGAGARCGRETANGRDPRSPVGKSHSSCSTAAAPATLADRRPTGATQQLR